MQKYGFFCNFARENIQKVKKKGKIRLSWRKKWLLGLITPPGMKRLSYLLSTGFFILMLIPWVGVMLGFRASWESIALGDEVIIPIWAWVAAVATFVLPLPLCRIFSNRILAQYYIRKRRSL